MQPQNLFSGESAVMKFVQLSGNSEKEWRKISYLGFSAIIGLNKQSLGTKCMCHFRKLGIEPSSSSIALQELSILTLVMLIGKRH